VEATKLDGFSFLELLQLYCVQRTILMAIFHAFLSLANDQGWPISVPEWRFLQAACYFWCQTNSLKHWRQHHTAQCIKNGVDKNGGSSGYGRKSNGIQTLISFWSKCEQNARG